MHSVLSSELEEKFPISVPGAPTLWLGEGPRNPDPSLSPLYLHVTIIIRSKAFGETGGSQGARTPCPGHFASLRVLLHTADDAAALALLEL